METRMVKNKVIFLSSAQASSKDLSQGVATYLFQNPFDIPNAQVGLLEFSFTNFFINISAAIGNNKFYYSNDSLNPTKFTITIPDGSYSLSSLNDYLTQQQPALSGSVVFSLLPNYSTNKIAIVFTSITGYYVHFGADSPFELMGFTNGQNVPASKNNTSSYVEYAPNIAQFNNITSIKVRCDLTTDTISNGRSSSIIFQTAPIVEVGSVQTDRAYNIAYCDLTTTRFSSITIQLLDQLDRPITVTEDYSITLIIRYVE
jgi:hypothetical protein